MTTYDNSKGLPTIPPTAENPSTSSSRQSALSGIKSLIRRSVRPIHHHFRSGKSELFMNLLPDHPGNLLDVGGGTGMSGEFTALYRKFESVIVINLGPLTNRVTGPSNVSVIKGDGRSLPFADKSFHWVFSNAVIEHVGGWNDQKQFAAEIRRVASNGYFVTTPNLYFPIDPHALLPLYQFYPERLKPLALKCSPGYMTEPEPINLLSRKKLQLLFPDAHVKHVNFASSVIAFEMFRSVETASSSPALYSAVAS